MIGSEILSKPKAAFSAIGHMLATKHGKIAVAGAFLAITLIANLLFMLWHGQGFTDSDMASELILADLLNQEGEVLSSNWIYGNELRLANCQLVYRLGLSLFPNNWLYARAFSLALLLLGLAASYVYFARGLSFGYPACLYGAAIVIAPYTFWQVNLITFGAYYVPHVLLALLALGAILRLSRGRLKSLGNFASALLLTVVALSSGLNGVRLLLTFYAPMLAASMLTLLYALRHSLCTWPLKASFEVKCSLLSLYATGCWLLGYLINDLVLRKFYSFYSYGNQMLESLELGKMLEVLSKFLSMCGYQQTAFWVSEKLISIQGFCCCMGLLTAAAMVFSMVCVARRWRILPKPHRIMVALLYACLALNSLVLSMSVYNESYLLPIMPFAFAVLQIAVMTGRFQFSWGRRAVSVLLALCLAASSYTALCSYYQKPLRGDPRRVAVSNWLVENGYREGYARFWNGNVLTELSNGVLELWNIASLDDPAPVVEGVLQKKDHFTRLPSQKPFLITDIDALPSPESFVFNQFNGQEVYNDGRFVVYSLQSSSQ